METLKVLALAVLQGVTEFLPVSSSGHLVIAGKLLGIESPCVRVEIMLHFGTLLSVVAYYRKRLATLVAGLLHGSPEAWKTAAALFAGCVPAGIVYLLFGDFIEGRFDGAVRFVGCMLLVTGGVLLSLRFVRGRGGRRIGLLSAILIGCAQAAAMLPGLSRSGATIACARHLGADGRDAAAFSFLMSLPILLGATAIQAVRDFRAPVAAEGIGALPLALAVAVSAGTGYFAIRLLMRTLIGEKFWLFGLYCLLAGAVALFA